MARKRKKSTRRRSRRRGSMLGATGSAVTNILSVVAGAVAGRFIQSKLTTVNPKIVAGGQIVAGVLLPRFVKNEFVKGIGVGMIANGGVETLKAFGVLSGIGEDMSVEYIGGSDDISTIAGDDGDDMGYDGSSDISTIAGMDDEIGAFEDEMYS